MDWKESYMGGSKEAEEELFGKLAERIKGIQIMARKRSDGGAGVGSAALQRGFHAKGTGVRARFRIVDKIPKHLQTSFFRQNAEYDALVRFSNASSEIVPDSKLDQRGAAIRVKLVEGEPLRPDNELNIQDFLMTNTPVSFARDPQQFMVVGELILASKFLLLPKLFMKYGAIEAVRIMKELLRPIRYQTWQTTQFWSRTPFKFNDYAVKFMLRPCEKARPGPLAVWMHTAEADFLKKQLEKRLQQGDVQFDFRAQLFVDNDRTPIEDASKEWEESVAPFITIAQLIIPKQRLDDTVNSEIHRMAFTPWHTKDHQPLGRTNRARKKVYEASADERMRALGYQ